MSCLQFDLRVFDGADWVECSDTGVNTANTDAYSGYIWARIRTDTTPSLDDLTGTPFSAAGTAPPL